MRARQARATSPARAALGRGLLAVELRVLRRSVNGLELEHDHLLIERRVE
jgi:hypothetical protein